MFKLVGRIVAGAALLSLGAGAGFGILNGGAAGASTTYTVDTTLDNVSLSTPSSASGNENQCSVREAILEADASDGDATINIPTAGTYAVDSGSPTQAGQLDISNSGHTVTVVGADQATVILRAECAPVIEGVQAHASPNSVTCAPTNRVLKVETGTTAVVSGVTIENGDPSGGNGGGILNCGTLTLSNSTVNANTASDSGGGIEQSSGGSTTLTNVTVSDNTTTGGGDGGGGIDVVGESESPSSMTITNSTITGNSTVSYGGGVAITGSDNAETTVLIQGSHINANTLTGDDQFGGGIDQEAVSTLTVTGTSIDNNTTTGSDDSGGGAFLDAVGAIDVFTNDTLSGNEAYIGGGLYDNESAATFTGTSINDNTVADGAGGVFDFTENSETLAINSSSISDNTVTGLSGDDLEGRGGGIVSDGCNLLTLTNDTIADNTASNNGGGYYGTDCNGVTPTAVPGVHPHVRSHVAVGGGSTSFLFDTITGNTADESEATAGNIVWVDKSDVTMANTIVAYGEAGESQTTNCSLAGNGTFTSNGYNLIDDTTCGSPASTDIIGKNPLLGSLGNNGGPTKTELPASGSPAINAIPTAACDGITTDQRGVSRPGGAGNTCTIGSVEVPQVIFNPNGYRLAAMDGGAFDFGIFFGGSLANNHLNAPIVGLSNEPGPTGYLMVGADGGVFSFAGAHYYGSLGGQSLPSPIAGIATTPDGNGYWLVSQAGKTYNFGDAPALGSLGKLNAPIVGIATTPDGKGAWLVAADGGVFALGTATYEGSMGGKHLNAPMVGIAPSPNGQGYVLAAADGGVFAFGNAGFHGSTGSLHLNAPVVGIAETDAGDGYWLVAADGGVFAFGNAPFLGSMGGVRLNAPIVGIQHLGAAAA